MGAVCYLCELNYGVIPGQTAGDAAGACKLCGVLACRGHGVRNASKPAYICGCCLPNLLASAALRQAGGAAPLPPRDTPAPQDGASGYGAWAVGLHEVADVLGDPEATRWAWMREDVNYLARPFDANGVPEGMRAFAKPQAGEARRLLATAITLAVALRLPEDELLPILRVALEMNRA